MPVGAHNDLSNCHTDQAERSHSECNTDFGHVKDLVFHQLQVRDKVHSYSLPAHAQAFCKIQARKVQQGKGNFQ